MVKDVCSILLVDDEPLPRKLLSERIAKIPGVEVVASLADGLSAKNYLLEHPVDIVMTDIRMPGMDGLALAEFIHTNNMGCGIIIFSGYEEFEYARQALKYSVIDYLLKPLHFAQVVEALEKARSAVLQSRERIRFSPPFPYRDLEQVINRTIQAGKDFGWLQEQLAPVFQYPGKLLQISLDTYTGTVQDNFFEMCRNLLQELFPRSLVFIVSKGNNSSRFLVLPQSDQPLRSIQSIQGWFSHVFVPSLTITTEGDVTNSQELAELSDSRKKPDHNQIIAIACDYIQNNLSQPLSREDVSARVFLSPSYFGHLFKKIMGVGYNDYVTELRIRQAQSLLAQNISIREVAQAVGFRDVKYFSEIFCRKTGFMPSKYRHGLLTGTIKQESSL